MFNNVNLSTFFCASMTLERPPVEILDEIPCCFLNTFVVTESSINLFPFEFDDENWKDRNFTQFFGRFQTFSSLLSSFQDRYTTWNPSINIKKCFDRYYWKGVDGQDHTISDDSRLHEVCSVQKGQPFVVLFMMGKAKLVRFCFWSN